jgi:hypothetical protein
LRARGDLQKEDDVIPIVPKRSRSFCHRGLPDMLVRELAHSSYATFEHIGPDGNGQAAMIGA